MPATSVSCKISASCHTTLNWDSATVNNELHLLMVLSANYQQMRTKHIKKCFLNVITKY